MALRNPKIAVGQRVIHQEHPCVVLAVSQSKLDIRDKYGFVVTIPRKGAKLAN